MRIISFAWTVPALIARRKTCTRRNWERAYAESWRKGEYAAAYDRSPRMHGSQVGIVRLTEKPYKESTGQMPADDYENEGLAWMEEQLLLIREISPRQFWQEWIETNETIWVIRFEIISVEATSLTLPLWPNLTGKVIKS